MITTGTVKSENVNVLGKVMFRITSVHKPDFLQRTSRTRSRCIRVQLLQIPKLHPLFINFSRKLSLIVLQVLS